MYIEKYHDKKNLVFNEDFRYSFKLSSVPISLLPLIFRELNKNLL
jgi:hypothetical protein